MPKYVLHPDGSIKNENNEEVSKRKIASDHTKKASSFWDNQNDLLGDFAGDLVAEVNLPVLTNVTLGKVDPEGYKAHIIQSETFAKESNSEFVNRRESDNKLVNPSFGVGNETKLESYKNFNNFLNNDELFASELEIIAGFELTGLGFDDLTRFVFIFDYILEAILYIAAIEAISESSKLYDFDSKKYMLGTSGVMYSDVFNKYIFSILKYPSLKPKYSTIDSFIVNSSCFILGLSLFINTDPKIFNDWSKNNPVIEDLVEGSRYSSFLILINTLHYLTDSLTSLSSIGNNRLKMLIRRFHQKSDWHQNKLFKAKTKSQNNNIQDAGEATENFLVELNYYYVKFIIERMHVGKKLFNTLYGFNSINEKYSETIKLIRSGRLRDSLRNMPKISYELANKSLEIKDEKNKLHDKSLNKSSISMSVLPQAFIMPSSFIQSFNNYNYKGHLGDLDIDEKISQYFIRTEKRQQRLSQETVAKLEKYYEKESVPFYFQDIRTNEIIGFHAFIDSINESFSPQYNETTAGFGRVDKVYHYINTSRNLSISFTLAAMSYEDHDLMWYQINKLIAMVYPQWSEGKKNQDMKEILKNNDETSNLDIFSYPLTQVPIASPLIRIRLGDYIKSNMSETAFANLHDPYVTENNTPLKEQSLWNEIKDDDDSVHYVDWQVPGTYQKKDKSGIAIKDSRQEELTFVKEYSEDFIKFKLFTKNNDENYKNKKLINEVVKNYVKPFARFGNAKVPNNPIAAAYDSTIGTGLAGFIANLDINTQDQQWHVGENGKNGPMAVKITIQFNVVHDIAPGLDANGAMRAPTHNIGNILGGLYGDVYDKDKKIKKQD